MTPQNTAIDAKITTIKIERTIKTTGNCIFPVMPEIVTTMPNANSKIKKNEMTIATYLLNKYPKILIGYVFKSEYQPDSISLATLILPIAKMNSGSKNSSKFKKLAV